MTDWAADLYNRLLPRLSEAAVREFALLSANDLGEFYATLIFYALDAGIMTEEDKDQAAEIVRTVNGITFRKLRSQILQSLDRELVPA